MKTKSILSFFLIMCCLNVLAQRKNSISLTAGVSIPLADFADKAVYNNSHAGAAKPGINVNIGFSHLLREYKWGYAVSVVRSENKFDADVYKAGFGGAGEWSSSNYVLMGFYGGGFYSLEVNDKITIDIRALAGAASCTMPDTDCNFGLGNSVTIRPTSSELVFSYQGGVGMSYSITERTGILVNAALTGAKATFTVLSTFKGVQDEVSEVNSIELPMTMISIGLGVTYKL